MRIGIIGTGVMGENHVKTYVSLVDHCQIAGVYDSNAKRAEEVAAKYKIKSFKSVTDLLERVDAVSIAVPTEYHYEIGLLCVRHKVHMLMEKPITSSIEQANDLIEKAKANGVILQVGHIELFNPVFQALKKVLKNEEIIAVEVHRTSLFDKRLISVDVVLDLMIHDIYLLCQLLDSEIEYFQALGRRFEDTTKHAVAICRFRNGTIAQVTASLKTVAKSRMIRIVTNNAYIQADLAARTIMITRSANLNSQNENKGYRLESVIEKAVAESEPLKVQLIDFLECIRQERKPTVSGNDGKAALSVSLAISRQITEHYEGGVI